MQFSTIKCTWPITDSRGGTKHPSGLLRSFYIHPGSLLKGISVCHFENFNLSNVGLRDKLCLHRG